ncbi:MAG TPA: TIGR01777 family oxidoreductase [Gemmatimonadaceae bacterium]|jgi:hypothetical protein
MTYSHRREPDQSTRRIAISGASGFLGAALAAQLQREGMTVQRLRRSERATPPDVSWRPDKGEIDIAALNGVDAIVNLAGAQIARRWTHRRKREIRDSRVTSTTVLANAIARLEHPPTVFVSGSAIGVYGDRGDEELDEESAIGTGFLADVASAWEQSTEPARLAGIRVVLIRTGIVLNPSGGALAKLLLPFKLGIGGRIGLGTQWMSWIGLEDWIAAVEFALAADVAGPVNLVAPNPVPNADFVTTLARVLGRPTLLPVPASAISLVFGEMGRETLLGSQRVHPRRLVKAGFEFAHPTLEQSLRQELALGASPAKSQPLAPQV